MGATAPTLPDPHQQPCQGQAPALGMSHPGTRTVRQGCAGAMPPSATTSKPQPPWLGEGTPLSPLTAHPNGDRPYPSSLLCMWGPFQCRGWLGGSKAAAWGHLGQTQARYNEGQEPYLCRASLGLTPCTQHLWHPKTVSCSPRAAPPPDRTPQERLNTAAGGTQCRLPGGQRQAGCPWC